MAQSYTELGRTVFGDKRVVFYLFDANGTGTGYQETGLDSVLAVFSQNSEVHTEHCLVVRNSNNGTEDSLAGAVYVSAPDSTNTTAYLMVIGL